MNKPLMLDLNTLMLLAKAPDHSSKPPSPELNDSVDNAPDKGPDWWHELSHDGQQAYLMAHKNSAKKYTTHEEHANYHNKASDTHAQRMKYWNERAAKEKDPDKKAKYEDKADQFSNLADYHKDVANNHLNLKVAGKPYQVKKTNPAPESNKDNNNAPPDNVVPFPNSKPNKVKNPANPKANPTSQKKTKPAKGLHLPLPKKALHKRVAKAYHDIVHMDIDNKNKIIAEAAKQLTPQEKQYLDEAIESAKNKNSFSKRAGKVLGKILLAVIVSGVLLSLGHGTGLQGVMALMAMHHINEKHDNQGLGKIAYKWLLSRPIDDTHDEKLDEKERSTKLIVDELKIQLKRAHEHAQKPPEGTPKNSPKYQEYLQYHQLKEHIENIISTVKEAAEEYAHYDKIDLDDDALYNKKHRRKTIHKKASS